MADPYIRATARVQVVLDIAAGSTWGPECTTEQIHKQAKEGALGYLQKAMDSSARFRLVGEPVVQIITHEEKR